MRSNWRWIIRVLRPVHDIAVVITAAGILFSAAYFFITPAGRIADFILKEITGFDVAPYVRPISLPVRLLISGIISTLLLVLILYIRRSLVYRRRMRHILEEFRICLREHLQFINQVNDIQESRAKDKRVRLAEKFRDHGVFLCARISEMFETLTQCKCHTTIKSFDPATGNIKTRARDVLMHNRDRSQADEGARAFTLEDHSAFSTIVANPKRYMFISNHLLLQSFLRQYINRNPDWRKYYRATAVAPITEKRRASDITKQSVIGFITVDSRHGRFTRRTSRAILSLFIELVYDSMIHLGWKDDIAQ
jgi:hypothetical protein